MNNIHIAPDKLLHQSIISDTLQKLWQRWSVSKNGNNLAISDAKLNKIVINASYVKRLKEKISGNPSAKNQILNDFTHQIKKSNLDISIDQIKLLGEQSAFQISTEDFKNFYSYQKLIEVQYNWAQYMVELAADNSNPNFKAWRKRQIWRCMSQLGGASHFPLSIELSKGCSVGCWFCGVAAPSLEDIYFYTPKNARLWQDILIVGRKLFGSAAGSGFCYCASDPLDNPDYEKFLGDFYDILGFFPQTTTAQPLKNANRTRKLLRLSLEKGCMLNRFSIISLKQLEQLHQEFTPEELAFVGLVLQNPESGRLKSNSGRARHNNQRTKLKQQLRDQSEAGTTACISGFLLNMIDRTVKLISPYPASTCYPLGYRIYQQGTFRDAEDLQQFMEDAIAVNMPLTVRPSDLLRFRSDLQYEPLPNGFQLSTKYLTLEFCQTPQMKQLGEIIHQGESSVEQIANLFSILGISASDIYRDLNFIFNRGVLDEEFQQTNTLNNCKSTLITSISGV
jgi:radical SAM family RiPP maturation amino acid epimerase